ncbi:hypothetical protein IWQ57_003342, partial [Coemansia nantahalensis]
TSVLLGQELDPVLPYNDYYDFYGPEFRLDVPASNMDNANTPEYLAKIHAMIAEQLRSVPHAPSVQMQEVPRDWPDSDGEEDDRELDTNPESKVTRRQRDARVVPHTELYDSDGEDLSPNTYTPYRHTGTATRPAHGGAGK